jgi:hypothetical protein
MPGAIDRLTSVPKNPELFGDSVTEFPNQTIHAGCRNQVDSWPN